MKTIQSILITMLTLLGVASAHADMDRESYYVAGSGAMDWVIANSANHSFQSTTTDPMGTSARSTLKNKLDSKHTFSGHLAAGYALDNWRFELEGGYRNGKQAKNPIMLTTTTVDTVNINNSQNINTSSVSVKEFANISDWTLMGNVYYDIPLSEDFSWYVGAGAGVAFETKKVSVAANSSTTQNFPVGPPVTNSITTIKEKDILFAYQVMTGVSYAITDNIDATLGYRFTGTSKPKDFTGKLVSGNTTSNYTMSMQKWPHAHSVEAGIRFKL